ncbi:MAG: TolC family protein [Flammeovirgaceae bacterium]|nr:TolC family protein [Flammeovirgaceae bacterium]
MKQVYLLLTFLLIAHWGTAQNKVFTLEESIQYALQNSTNVQNSSIDERIAQSKVRETVGMGLPQVTGTASLDHNEKLRRFFSTYTPGGFFDFSGVPGIQSGDVVAAENFFQLKSSGDVGININQLIFNGSYLVGLQASSAYKELTYKASTQTKAQTVEAVTKAFYSALINKERVKLFDNNIARVDSLLQNTKALNENGFVEAIDVDRVSVQLNNLITEREKFVNLQLLSVELLKFQMNYPMSETIDVTGDLNTLQAEVNPDDYLSDFNFEARPEYQVLLANKRLQQLNIKNNYAGSMPVLSAHANLGYATQSANISGLFKTESNFSEVPGVGPDKWYGYSTFGLSFTMPIFTGLSRTHKIQQEKLAMAKIENGEKTLKASFDLETRQAISSYQNSLKSLQAQKRNVDLAENIARVTKIKYEQGVGSNLEVVNAESDLRESQINYYNSLYDLLNSKVDLDKAFGKLYTTENQN